MYAMSQHDWWPSEVIFVCVAHVLQMNAHVLHMFTGGQGPEHLPVAPFVHASTRFCEGANLEILESENFVFID